MHLVFFFNCVIIQLFAFKYLATSKIIQKQTIKCPLIFSILFSVLKIIYYNVKKIIIVYVHYIYLYAHNYCRK